MVHADRLALHDVDDAAAFVAAIVAGSVGIPLSQGFSEQEIASKLRISRPSVCGLILER